MMLLWSKSVRCIYMNVKIDKFDYMTIGSSSSCIFKQVCGWLIQSNAYHKYVWQANYLIMWVDMGWEV